MFKLLQFASLILLLFFILDSVYSACDNPSVTTASGTHAPTGEICSGDLIFEDNFDSFDLRKWQHELTLAGGGNWEFQWYLNNRVNSYVRDSILYVKPSLVGDEAYLSSATLDINGGGPADECTNAQFYGCLRTGTAEDYLNPIKSARLRTLYSFSFKYGKVEISAKTPKGDWLWPALWMLPRDNQYSTWPESGEIDIMESRGNSDFISASGQNIGTKLVGSTMHWGPDYTANKYELTHYEKESDVGFNEDFHKYQVEWTPNEIIFSVDDQEIGRVTPPEGGFWELGKLDESGFENPWVGASKMAPFDKEFYLIINLAVGGINYFPDDATNGNGAKPWLNTSPTATRDFWQGKDNWMKTWDFETENSAFQIDYVRVWAL